MMYQNQKQVGQRYERPFPLFVECLRIPGPSDVDLPVTDSWGVPVGM